VRGGRFKTNEHTGVSKKGGKYSVERSRLAAITGATGGIGLALALQAPRRGLSVVLADD
jgi:NADP-dependent 3-hydroxy acid dehydrogenase YdfG